MIGSSPAIEREPAPRRKQRLWLLLFQFSLLFSPVLRKILLQPWAVRAPLLSAFPMIDLRICCWNIRGLNASSKTECIVNMCNVNRCNIVAVLETKVSQSDEPKIAARMKKNWPFFTNSTPLEKGRIWIMWDPDFVDIRLLQASAQVMHCYVSPRGNTSPFVASFVYAFNTADLRAGAWDFLTQAAAYITEPWIVCGDFNCFLFEDEKISSNENATFNTDELSSMVLNANIIDLEYSGCKFTWSNMQRGEERMAIKLDRVLVNDPWLQTFERSRAFFDAPMLSDHSPALVTLFSHQRIIRSSFKFKNYWTEDPDFQHLVANAWSVPASGSRMYSFVQKLKHVKEAMKTLDRQRYKGIPAKIKLLNEALENVQMQLQGDMFNIQLHASVNRISSSLTENMKLLDSIVQQKAKIDWLRFREETSGIFYRQANSRRRSSRILMMKGEGGILLEDRDQIVNHILASYQLLLGTSHSDQFPPLQVIEGPTVMPNDIISLLRMPTKEDIKRVAWGINVNKSPGPDGFNSQFFKSSWSIIGEDLYRAVLEFFQSGFLLRQINCTLVSLVPKVPNPTVIGDYRPISCCNVLLKIITKLLAGRVQEVIGAIIDPNQGAFVPGRSIAHNIVIAEEIVKGYAWANTPPRCTIKIDLRKAYDTLSWPFLKHVLEFFGLPTFLVRLIMECVSTPSFSFLIEGESAGFFQSKCGLRQGDPISSYLFVLVMEFFSRMLKRACSAPGFHYHPRCKALRLTHISFADDLLLFCKGDVQSVSIMKRCIQQFSEVSGLSVNESKSKMYLAGVSEQVANHLSSIMGFARAQFPFKYLGIPLHTRKIQVQEYAALIRAFSSAIQRWATKHMAYSSRLQLIKTVLYGILSFWNQTTLLPQVVIDKLTSLCRAFLWGGSVGGNRCLIAWDKVTVPFEEGGLDIKEVLAWNKATLFKLAADVIRERPSI